MLEDSHHKASEQYPLLMVAGAGDATVRVPPPIGPNLWTTTMAPRRSWKERWPEYLSSCWLATILLGISFLVFYSVAMALLCRGDGYLIFKLNDTKPASEVFYHHIVPRGGDFPLSKYASYLANVATEYPSLTFKVFFLIDDTTPRSILEQIYTHTSFLEYNAYNKGEVKVFQNNFANVYISVMSLSRFMAGTPLKYKWRNIPIKYIPFYCRTFAVWLYGGIGLDLAKHNDYYRMGDPQRIDRKARVLLKQHNDGIVPEKYIKNLKKLESEDEFEYLASFLCLMQKIFKDTVSYFNAIQTFPTSSSERPAEPRLANTKSLVRTHRTKREALDFNEHNEKRMALNLNQDNDKSPGNNISNFSEVKIILNNKTVINVTAESSKNNVYETVDQSNTKSDAFKKIETPELVLVDNGWYFSKILKNNNSKVGSIENSHGNEKNHSDGPKILFFYDFLPDEGKPNRPDVSFIPNKYRTPLKVVTIEAEGSFVASTGRTHPFLGAILSAGCKRLSPKFAIQNSLMIICSDLPKNDICNNIHVL